MDKVALEHTVATWEVLLHMHDCMTPTFSFSFWSRVVSQYLLTLHPPQQSWWKDWKSGGNKKKRVWKYIKIVAVFSFKRPWYCQNLREYVPICPLVPTALQQPPCPSYLLCAHASYMETSASYLISREYQFSSLPRADPETSLVKQRKENGVNW